jgi:hypothetical protein
VADSPNNQTGANATERQTTEDVLSVVGPQAATPPQPPPTPPENHHPKKRRRWTNDPAMFWVTLAGVIVVIAYTSVAAWQAYLMQGQFTAMEADRKPFVGIEEKDIAVTKPLTFTDTAATLSFSVPLKNVGKSVALGIMVFDAFHLGYLIPQGQILSFRDIQEGLKNWVNCTPFLANQFNGPGLLILPGASYDLTVDGKSERNAFTPDPKTSRISPFFSFCVIYRDDIGRSHGTGLILQFASDDSKADFPLEITGVVNGRLKFFSVGASVF